jgi:predicted double-glycine peptidase
MDLVDESGELYKYAYDVVLLSGIYEYAMKKNKLLHISKPMIVYNSNNGNNDHQVAMGQQAGTALKVFSSEYSVLKLL